MAPPKYCRNGACPGCGGCGESKCNPIDPPGSAPSIGGEHLFLTGEILSKTEKESDFGAFPYSGARSERKSK